MSDGYKTRITSAFISRLSGNKTFVVNDFIRSHLLFYIFVLYGLRKAEAGNGRDKLKIAKMAHTVDYDRFTTVMIMTIFVYVMSKIMTSQSHF